MPNVATAGSLTAPSVRLYGDAKMREMPEMSLPAAAHVCAAASPACRCAGVAFAGMSGVHSDESRGPVCVSTGADCFAMDWN